jgi:peptidoglycan hydrolase-like protein with peptidoglycan-binding domain
MPRLRPLALLISATLATAALQLSFPAIGSAGERQDETGESSVTALSSAGLLSRGAGYASRDGSTAVKALQFRLRRLGHAPGPLDGFFGPRTEGAVERFQAANGLVVDGVVGPKTRKRLLPPPPKPAAPQTGAAGDLPRTRPLPAPPDVPAPRVTTPAGDRESEPSGLAPGYAALLGALVAALAATGFWVVRGSRRPPAPESRMNLGMVGSVLLAVFAVGAAGGAVFATWAAPSGFDDAELAALRATTPDGPRAVAPVADRPRPIRRATRTAATARRQGRGEGRRAAAAAPAPRMAAAPAGRRAVAPPAAVPPTSPSLAARAPAAPRAPPRRRLRATYTAQPVAPPAVAASPTVGAAAGERFEAP